MYRLRFTFSGTYLEALYGKLDQINMTYTHTHTHTPTENIYMYLYFGVICKLC